MGARRLDLYGVDLTDAAIDTTAARLALDGLTSRLQRLDAETLPFDDGFFDVVYSWGVIHHSEHPAKIIAEIQRVLKPGGTFIGMLYGRRSVTALHFWIRHALKAGRPWRTFADVIFHHVESVGTRAYTIPEVRQLFSSFRPGRNDSAHHDQRHGRISEMAQSILSGPMGMVHRDPGGRMIPLVDLKSQCCEVKPEIDRAIASILERGAYIGGPEIDEFERWFADFCGVRHAIGVSSGTTALELVLRALGDRAGRRNRDSRRTPSWPWAPPWRPPAPVPCSSTSMSAREIWIPDGLRHVITPRTKAIIPVHLYGRPAAMGDILDASRPGIPVSKTPRRRTARATAAGVSGRLSTAGVLQLLSDEEPRRLRRRRLITTDDDTLAAALRLLRDHGRISQYEHAVVGQTARTRYLQAAVLRAQADAPRGMERAPAPGGGLVSRDAPAGGRLPGRR